MFFGPRCYCSTKLLSTVDDTGALIAARTYGLCALAATVLRTRAYMCNVVRVGGTLANIGEHRLEFNETLVALMNLN